MVTFRLVFGKMKEGDVMRKESKARPQQKGGVASMLELINLADGGCAPVGDGKVRVDDWVDYPTGAPTRVSERRSTLQCEMDVKWT